LSNGPDRESAAAAAAPAQNSLFLTVFPPIMLPMFLAVVDQTIVATALPAIAADLGRIERAPWVIVGYLIAATIAAPLYGRLGDSFGRKPLMFVALLISTTASLACATAGSIEMLTFFRVMQGLGGGGLMTLSQALIGEAMPPRDRARYQGYIAAVAVTANSFGPVVGGFLSEHFGWQSVFLVNVPVAVLALGLAIRLPKPPKDRLAWRSDPGGLVLFAVFVATTLLSLEQFQRANIAAMPLASVMLAVGVIALVLLIRHENRTPSPLIPLGLLRQPAIWRSDALAVCHGGTLVALISFFPAYLEVVRGMSPSTTGLMLVPLTVGIGTGAMVIGRIVSRTGLVSIFPACGLGIVAVSLVAFALWGAHFGATAIGVFMLWLGLSFGTVMGVVQVTVQSVAGRLRLGEAAASVQFSRSIGAGMGTALAGTVLFAVLALESTETMRVFAALIAHAGDAVSALPVERQAAIKADIDTAFRFVFLTLALFATMGSIFAFTNPLRRIT
jgi:EmrB/QacA subfamily drug resistance transporter